MSLLLEKKTTSSNVEVVGFTRQKERVNSSSVPDRIRPRNLPPIQANIRTNGTVRTVELTPVKPSSTTPRVRSPSMLSRDTSVKATGLTQKSPSVTVGTSRLRTSSQIPRQSLSVRLALTGLDGGNPMIVGGIVNDRDYRFMLGGLIDGFTGRQTFLESTLQHTIRERGAYKWGYGITDNVRLATVQTVRDIEQQRRRFWENRPTFEIPQIKLPSFEFPEIKLPEIKLPELPELPKLDIRLPQLKPIPTTPKINIRKPEKTELEKIREIDTPACGGYIFDAAVVYFYPEPPYHDDEGVFVRPFQRASIKDFLQALNDGTPYPSNFTDLQSLFSWEAGGYHERYLPDYDCRVNTTRGRLINADGSTDYLKYPRYGGYGLYIQGYSNSKIASALDFLQLSPEPVRFFTFRPSKEGCYIRNIPNIEPPSIPKEKCCMSCSRETQQIDYRLIKKIVTDTIKEQSFSLDVPLVSCEQDEDGNWQPKITNKTLEFFAPTRLMAQQQAEIHHENARNASELCLAKNGIDNEQCVAAIPLHWQLRPEGNRPQLIIQFGEDLGNNKIGAPCYPITIPHYKGEKLTQSPVPAYTKGSWEEILVLTDNSKVTVNALNDKEANKVINAILPLIKPEFATGSYRKGGFIRGGEPIKESKVIPKLAKYFSTGQKKNLPDWIAKLY
ncbi:hypothetical protein [Calothrix rhizosoleniae]|uniref:hypothetical protein n=1 Tax=Calothrix rhizosoleniae TaxID=888997 RepID=UPI000B49B4B2|nr:hypothetical protein [Calothrix rhizosoleniae]